jgi:hypothetical protein
MRHGHGAKKDEIDIDAERFFRAVDRAVLEPHSKPSGLPLILAALPEHHSLFRQVSHSPFLLSKGIDVHKPEVTGYGWKAITLIDPDGYQLCFQWPLKHSENQTNKKK